MGGRGASSGLGSGVNHVQGERSLSSKISLSRNGAKSYGALDANITDGFTNGVSDTLASLGLSDSVIKGIYVDETMSDPRTLAAYERRRPDQIAIASTNGAGEITLNGGLFRNENDFARISAQSRSVSSTPYGTGAHEAAHAAVAYLNHKSGASGSDWRSGKTDKDIIAKADRKFRGSVNVSRYAGVSASEKVAESVSDVMTNRSKANSYSKFVFHELKRRLKGG